MMARPKNIRQAWPGIGRFARHFSPYLHEHRGLIAGAMAALIAQTLLRLLEPWPLKFVIDRIVDQDGAGHRTTIEWLSSLDNETYLAIIAIALVIITSIRALTGYYSTVGFALVGNKVLTNVRNTVFRHLQNLSLAFHDKARSGDLVIRVIGDIGMLKEMAVTAVMPLVGNLLVLVGMFAVMFWLHWQLALLVVATTPLLWLLTINRSKRIQEVSRRNRKREGVMAATAAESIGAIKTVQALSLGEQFNKVFATANNRSLKEGVQVKRLSANLERSVDVLVAIATALVLWYGAHLVLSDELSAGELLIFIFYLRRAFRPLRDFAKYTARLAKASAAGERVLELLEQEPDVREQPNAKTAPAFKGDIAFQNIQFGYTPDQFVLDGLDLTFDAGQRVAIVGPSGTGKSTLAALLLRLYDPAQGSVKIDGQDIRKFTLNSLRNQIAVVLQDTLLFATSLRDNITAGVDVTQKDVETAARLANIHNFIMTLPDGYDTQVGERGVTLSNGQRQRIAIARAAIRQTPILILDEPTTGLDQENERLVLDAMYKLTQGRTTLIITHRPETAMRADDIIYLHKGTVLERGTHNQLIMHKGAYAQLFNNTNAIFEKATMEDHHAVSR
jgi:ATP-binding cassette subfamily B protein